MDEKILTIKEKIKLIYSLKLNIKDKEKLFNYLDILTDNELIYFLNIIDYIGNYPCVKITRSSILLTLKIYEQIGIKVFPYIEKIATKGFDIAGGSYAFGMYILDEGNTQILSAYRTKSLLLKKNTIYADTSRGLSICGDLELGYK